MKVAFTVSTLSECMKKKLLSSFVLGQGLMCPSLASNRL